jgi:ribosomal protein S12 methylthiotransferase
MSSNKINIVTLGCSKNLVDSEKMMALIRNGGYEVVHDAGVDAARVAIINTCGFIDDAKEESIETILRFVEARTSGKLDRLYVTGCLSQRYHKALKEEIPEVDGYFGVSNLPEIIAELKIEKGVTRDPERIITGPGHFAYMKVSEGCDRSCSFCAIPLIRGKHVSRPVEELVAEAVYLAEKGVRELILIAQDLTFYGMDIYGERRIAPLVKELTDKRLFDWVRLHYLYPSQFPDSLITVIQETPEVCRYIDIPVQHISDKLLKMMNRNHTRHKTIELLSKIRKEIPGAAIRTTLIVGHPGEGEAEFRELCDFVREFRFERMGVFAYSHEENTPGAKKFEDEYSSELKEQRVSEIMEIQQQISSEINSSLVGKEMNVMFDRREGEWLVGRTEYDSPEIDQEVLVPDNPEIKTGTMMPVRITGSGEFDLFGVIAAT